MAKVSGLTVSVWKINFMVGYGIEERNMQSIHISRRSIESVKELCHLGSLIVANGRIDVEIKKHLLCLVCQLL